MRRAVLLLIHGCVSSQLTHFDLYFSFIVDLGSSHTGTPAAAVSTRCELGAGEKAGVKVISVGNDLQQFQHSCMCGAHGEQWNCVAGFEQS